jgi:hypothetical protein
MSVIDIFPVGIGHSSSHGWSHAAALLLDNQAAESAAGSVSFRFAITSRSIRQVTALPFVPNTYKR